MAEALLRRGAKVHVLEKEARLMPSLDADMTMGLDAMLKEAGQDVRVGGNIGAAVTGLVEGSTRETVFVLEVSSFQLEGTQAFHPRVAVFLNLSPDHLDRHPSFEDYARAKARIFRNQTEEDWAVVNADDPGVLALAREGRARQMPFHPRPSPPAPDEGGPGAFFDAGEARLRRDRAVESLFPLSGVRPDFQLSVVVGVLDALYVPLRKRVAAAQFEEAKLRVTGAVLDFAAQVRSAFYVHQAAEQLIELRQTIQVSGSGGHQGNRLRGIS